MQLACCLCICLTILLPVLVCGAVSGKHMVLILPPSVLRNGWDSLMRACSDFNGFCQRTKSVMVMMFLSRQMFWELIWALLETHSSSRIIVTNGRRRGRKC